MKCPVCKDKKHVEIEAADGFAQDSRECGTCGTIWTFVNGERTIIKEGLSPFVITEYKADKFTKYVSCADEMTAEDQKVWFS